MPWTRHAAAQGGQGGAEVEDEVGWGQQSYEGLVEVAVALPVALAEVALVVQVAGEDFGVFVDAAILDDGAGLLQQAVVLLKATGEEEDLGVEAPPLHFLVKVGEVGVFGDGFEDGVPAEVLGQPGDESGFADADVAGDGDEVLGHDNG